ncbi:hypothetical protein HUT11_23420 [Streptomyces seoulensis]|nr:hypothetical protein HUT11_23420 [Streptomyces seoulensis]
MPRGRHRHSPPLHRLLPPSAIAGVSLVCAVGPWVFTAPALLRVLAAAAAVTAIGGAIIMRRWDAQAGRQVADLTRARASDEWRFEERVAELESDLEESRELRGRLEQKLRAKRTELAGLRNEHAALLRRYATAETERASALEGRRLLEIEAAPDARALPAALAASAVPVPPAGLVPSAKTGSSAASGAAAASGTARTDAPEGANAVAATAETSATEKSAGETSAGETSAGVAPAVFSPEGVKLFLRAQAALARLGADGGPTEPTESAQEPAAEPVAAADTEATAEASTDATAESVADETTEPADESSAEPDTDPRPEPGTEPSADVAPDASEASAAPSADTAPEAPAAPPVPRDGIATDVSPAREGDEADETDVVQGRPEAADGHEPAAGRPAQRPAGHFTVPTAVAVVPPTPVRRPSVEGGFDFFGTKNGAQPAALEAVQNEDLADVVGQEALALHKAEAESQYRPADAGTRAVGQVIDLTAHDETEQIDVQNLRSAAS